METLRSAWWTIELDIRQWTTAREEYPGKVRGDSEAETKTSRGVWVVTLKKIREKLDW